MAEFLTFYRVDVISPFYLFPSSVPFSYFQPLFPLVLHAHLQNYDANYDDLQGLTWVCPPERCRALAQAPSCCCCWGISAQRPVSHAEEWGELQSPFGSPHPHKSLLGTKGTSVSCIFTCAVWSLFSSSCLINCFVSFSSFLLFLRALFAYERHRGKDKGNQSMSLPLQFSSKLPQNHRAIEVRTDPGDSLSPSPAHSRVSYCRQKGNSHVGSFTGICYAGFRAFQAPKAALGGCQ